MAYDIRLVKLINGEIVLGKYNEAKNALEEPALLQTVPTEQGVQMLLLPFGYPFEQEFGGDISMTHSMYEYKNAPEDIKNKYLEATSNLTLANSSTLRNLNMSGAEGKVSDISSLLKK